MRNYEIPNSNLVTSSNTMEGSHDWQAQWRHLNRLSDGSTSGKQCGLTEGSDMGDGESFLGGVSLREWLKLSSNEINKVERLHLFRQIVQLVDFAHSRGFVLQDLRPSCLLLLPSMRVIYTGRFTQEIDSCTSSGLNFDDTEFNGQNNFSYQKAIVPTGYESNYLTGQLENKWYSYPERLNERDLLPSNVYCLGLLLFELLCCFDSSDMHSDAMLDLRHRILPPNFLSENPKEAGFCLWLLHPEPSSRPIVREILQSELICGSEELSSEGNLSSWTDKDAESELLLLFLNLLEEQKKKQTSKLQENIACLEADIKEVEGRFLLNTPSYWMDNGCGTLPMSNNPEEILMKNISLLENAYFYKRSQIQLKETASITRPDKDVLINHARRSRVQTEDVGPSMEGKPIDCLGEFFDGICKFANYKKFEVCGKLRNGDLLHSGNLICSLSFDREEDYIATAGVSKKIKVFELGPLMDDSVDIHYPVVEMSNKSKLSCVCWNRYIKNYLASTDYDGVVQMWDASTGQGFSQYIEHQMRAWSVDFSEVDPMKFASGSDDCSIKMWSINEKSSIGTIYNRANVCCVQFSPYSSNLLAFGSADFKVYCYDIRHTRIPWCTLAGHGKAVSYVKFLDSETIVSASTDNTLKLWDLNKTSLEGFSSDACSSSFTGHTNEKNFVGLSVLNGYIACGSETNEVYAYYRSLPMPISSHKLGCIDPISGHETTDNNEQFVSSVCWREKHNMVVAANSSGSIELLQLV